MTLRPQSACHPGSTILEYLEHAGWSQRDLARRTGLTPKTISEICNGKGPVTTPTALALERALGRPAHFWLSLQQQFDEAAERAKASQRARAWESWAAGFPVREMRERKWLAESNQGGVEDLLNFLGVSSPQSWDAVWKASAVAYRQTRTTKTNELAVAAWVRQTEIEAAQISTSPFDKQRLIEHLPELRACTRIRVVSGLEKARDICAAAGVAVVVVPELKQTGISGCARWLGESRALLALTLRYKFDDQIWFTFFHELGHLLMHKKKCSFVLDNPEEELGDNLIDPEMRRFEEEANQFAADVLIPPKVLGSFLERGEFGNKAIHRLADQIGVSPGIVVGRLVFEGVLAPHQGVRLKQRVRLANRLNRHRRLDTVIGKIFITQSGYDPELGKHVNDPYLGDQPTLGACRPDIRKRVKEGDHVFVVSGSLGKDIPQFVMGGFEVHEKVPARVAYERLPDQRLRLREDGQLVGNIIVDAKGAQHDLDNHNNFEARCENYLIGRNPVALHSAEERRIGRAETLEVLSDVFQKPISRAFDALHRGGRTLDEAGVKAFLEWLESVKSRAARRLRSPAWIDRRRRSA
jgi:addiction module HigA family antidote